MKPFHGFMLRIDMEKPPVLDEAIVNLQRLIDEKFEKAVTQMEHELQRELSTYGVTIKYDYLRVKDRDF